MTETAELADIVLPTALWGEKTGCFTNADFDRNRYTKLTRNVPELTAISYHLLHLNFNSVITIEKC